MPNHHAFFITTRRDGVYGSSLYYVNRDYVFRCSGNSNGGRTPTTFIRRRAIEYCREGRDSIDRPQVEYYPREGGHDGNPISVVLGINYNHPAPDQWMADNGVSWDVALREIERARDYVFHHPDIGRASRELQHFADNFDNFEED